MSVEKPVVPFDIGPLRCPRLRTLRSASCLEETDIRDVGWIESSVIVSLKTR